MTRARAYQNATPCQTTPSPASAGARLERDRRQAQHAAKVVEQAYQDLGLGGNLVAELEWPLAPTEVVGQDLWRQRFGSVPQRP